MIRLLEVCVLGLRWGDRGENGGLMRTEGLLGVAIVSGVALAAGLVGSALWKGLSRKR